MSAFLLETLPFMALPGPDAIAPGGGVVAHAANDFMGQRVVPDVGRALDIIVDLGAEMAADTIAILGANPVAGQGSAYIWGRTLNADFGAGGNLVASLGGDPGDLPAADGHHILWLGDIDRAPRWRYWRIVLAAAPGHQHSCMRILIGRRIQPKRNVEWGLRRGVRDLGELTIARLGAQGLKAGRRLRTLQFAFPILSKDETEHQVLPMLEQVGNSTPILACIDPAPSPLRSRRLYYGPLQGDPDTVWRSAAGFESRLRMESLI